MAYNYSADLGPTVCWSAVVWLILAGLSDVWMNQVELCASGWGWGPSTGLYTEVQAESQWLNEYTFLVAECGSRKRTGRNVSCHLQPQLRMAHFHFYPHPISQSKSHGQVQSRG